jgi:hypothetical protein
MDGIKAKRSTANYRDLEIAEWALYRLRRAKLTRGFVGAGSIRAFLDGDRDIDCFHAMIHLTLQQNDRIREIDSPQSNILPCEISLVGYVEVEFRFSDAEKSTGQAFFDSYI